jgi:hypothetical protein
MEGHYGGPFHQTYEQAEAAIRKELDMIPFPTYTKSIWENLFPILPLPWSLYANEPLTTLLHHSDCDGDLPVETLIPIAERLEEIAPAIRTMGRSESERFAEAALQFAKGCRAAAAAGEPIEFHCPTTNHQLETQHEPTTAQ